MCYTIFMATKKGQSPSFDRSEADHLLYSSLRAVYHFERSLVRRFGLGFQEIYLLQLLRRRESACVGEIAKALDVPIFSTTRLTQRLQAAGLISKRRCADDRRSVSVRLEPEGERLVAEIEARNFELIVGRTLDTAGAGTEHFMFVAKNLERVLGVVVDEGAASEPRLP